MNDLELKQSTINMLIDCLDKNIFLDNHIDYAKSLLTYLENDIRRCKDSDNQEPISKQQKENNNSIINYTELYALKDNDKNKELTSAYDNTTIDNDANQLIEKNAVEIKMSNDALCAKIDEITKNIQYLTEDGKDTKSLENLVTSTPIILDFFKKSDLAN